MERRTFKVKVRQVQLEIDNRWIVWYNPAVSKKISCHVNVELTVSRVGELFKQV